MLDAAWLRCNSYLYLVVPLHAFLPFLFEPVKLFREMLLHLLSLIDFNTVVPCCNASFSVSAMGTSAKPCCRMHCNGDTLDTKESVVVVVVVVVVEDDDEEEDEDEEEEEDGLSDLNFLIFLLCSIVSQCNVSNPRDRLEGTEPPDRWVAGANEEVVVVRLRRARCVRTVEPLLLFAVDCSTYV